MTAFAELIMTPAEIANWQADIKAWNDATTREYLAEIQMVKNRIQSEIDQCWALWEESQ